MTEMVIQQLLLDAGVEGVGQDLVAVEPRDLEVAADWGTVQSPETYVGYGQSTGFAQAAVAGFDAPNGYAAPARLPLNHWALAGNWTVARHAAVVNEPGGRIAFQFHAARHEPGDGASGTGRRGPVPGLPRWSARKGRSRE
jgi:hypothetical protein